MARHPVFCVNDVTEPAKIGMRVAYTYQNGMLTIYRKFNHEWKAIRLIEVKQYEAVEVIIQRGKVIVVKMSPPAKQIPLLAWLCGAPREACTESKTQYEQRINKYYDEKSPENDCYEWEESTQGWQFFWTKRVEEESKAFCVAYYIDENISKEDIIRLIRCNGVYPEWYTLKILSERFGVTKEEFERY